MTLTESMPLVSVIITCYNYGKYLSLALNSVLGQTYQNFEIILINDGSTDNTEKIVQPYLSDTRIRYVKQENSGQTTSKNKGIYLARGDFIAFLDADDIWEKTKLEEQIPLFEDRNVGVVYSRAKIIDENNNIIEFHKTPKYLIPRSGNVTKYLIFDNFVCFSTSIVSRVFIEKVGGFDESLNMGIDWDLWLRMSVHCRFACVDKPLARYRCGHSGQMSKHQDERYKNAFIIMNNFLGRNHGLLSEYVIRGAMAYTYCNRGYYYNNQDPNLAFRYFLLAIKEMPLHLSVYRGLLKNVLQRLLPN
jgi:glycosyltransferase involved in cell wall biosynthesis